MFADSSRYAGIETVEAESETGRKVIAIKLRRLPYVSGTPTLVKGHDRLDVISQRLYGDGSKFWHIADANTELAANALIAPRPQEPEARTIKVPEK